MRTVLPSLVILTSVASCGPASTPCTATVTAIYDGQGYTATCWGAAVTAGLDDNTIQSTSGDLTFEVVFYENQGNTQSNPPCSFRSGQMVTLTDPCLGVKASVYNPDGSLVWTATNSAGSTGSLQIQDWAQHVDDTMTVVFSSTAAIISEGAAVQVPLSGTATGPANL